MGCGAASQRYASEEKEELRGGQIGSPDAEESRASGASGRRVSRDATSQGAGYRQSKQPRKSDVQGQRVISVSSGKPPSAPPPPVQETHEEILPGVRRLQFSDFEQLGMLDETPMSSVFRLRHRRSGVTLAGKRIRKGCGVHQSGDYMNEVMMLQKLSKAPYIVSLHGVCDNGADFWTIMELCSGGRLESWLDQFPKSARNIVQQLLEAVCHLHSKLICHLDIKPDNVLLSGTGEVRLCDFVTSCQLQQAGQQLSGNCGTDMYRAPEVAHGTAYCGLKADVYSLGRTFKVVEERMMPRWQELTNATYHMTLREPHQRPPVLETHAALFGRQGAAPRPLEPQQVNWDSLESVSCQEAAANSSPLLHAQGMQPGGRATVSAAMAAAAAAATRPPPMASRQGIKGPSAKAQHQERQGYAPRVAPVASCKSSLCQRLGSCICQDRVPVGVSMTLPQDRAGAKRGLRRSNTP
eukprot:TRINITY_DN63261_c0_g1_i1.p1 TRINITY_DN63261_c0_g1~~TRINITY_DN63261_c0_g1_i1.p1  ORF type:complete len:467 (-),score=79.48 TRINITY_DN63261_c0_g1_i1:131-1531(-)